MGPKEYLMHTLKKFIQENIIENKRRKDYVTSSRALEIITKIKRVSKFKHYRRVCIR